MHYIPSHYSLIWEKVIEVWSNVRWSKLSIFTLLLDQTEICFCTAQFCSSVTSDVELEGKEHQRPSEECTCGGLLFRFSSGQNRQCEDATQAQTQGYRCLRRPFWVIKCLTDRSTHVFFFFKKKSQHTQNRLKSLNVFQQIDKNRH